MQIICSNSTENREKTIKCTLLHSNGLFIWVFQKLWIPLQVMLRKILIYRRVDLLLIFGFRITIFSIFLQVNGKVPRRALSEKVLRIISALLWHGLQWNWMILFHLTARFQSQETLGGANRKRKSISNNHNCLWGDNGENADIQHCGTSGLLLDSPVAFHFREGPQGVWVCSGPGSF